MTNSERQKELQRIRTLFQGEVLRSGAPLKRERFDDLWPALNFNARYCEGARNAVEILLTDGLKQSEYETAETELNMILGQAITEIEHGLSPPPPEVMDAKPKA